MILSPTYPIKLIFLQIPKKVFLITSHALINVLWQQKKPPEIMTVEMPMLCFGYILAAIDWFVLSGRHIILDQYYDA